MACRLFAASAVLSSLSVETWPEPVPKVMLVAVPPVLVAPIVSVSPLKRRRRVGRAGGQTESARRWPAADSEIVRGWSYPC